MQTEKSLGGKWLTAGLVVLGWSGSALFTTSYIILNDSMNQRYTPLGRNLVWQSATALGWISLTPFIFLIANKFPLGGGRLWRNILVHIFAGLSIILARLAIDAYVQPLIGFPPGRRFETYFQSFRFIFTVDFHYSVFNYGVALGLIFGTRYYRQFRERELRAAQLEARLSQARMHVLKTQLHPHFLFNTHNAISELIYKDPEAAEQMLADLSDLLRISLEKLEVEKIPLKQELDFLNKYLHIEQTRFQDRLRVRFDIEPETLDASVPNMILQPLVENAIKHGIAPLARGGTIEISAACDERKLHLEVSDDGIGVPFNNPSEIIEGIGLSNARARLAYLYPGEHEFDIEPNGSSGLRLRLKIPFAEQ